MNLKLYDVVNEDERVINSISILSDASTASIERSNIATLEGMTDVIDQAISLEAIMDDPYKQSVANMLALEILSSLGESPLKVSLEAANNEGDQTQWVITRAINGVYDKLKTVVKTIKTSYGNLKEAIAKRIEKADKLLGDTKDILNGISDKLVETALKAKSLVKGVVSRIGVNFKTLKQRLAIMDRVKDIEKIIVKLASDTYNKLLKLKDPAKIKKLIEAFNNKVNSIWSTVKTKGLGVIIDVKNHARVTVTKIKAASGSKATKIKNLSKSKINDLIKAYDASATKVKSTLSSTSDQITVLIDKIKKAVKEYSKEAVGRTKVVFANAYNTILNAIASASTVVSRIWSWVSETTVGFISAMTKRISSIVNKS